MVYDTETPSSGHVAQWQPSHTIQTYDDVDGRQRLMFIGQQHGDSDESPNTYDSKQFCIIACTETI